MLGVETLNFESKNEFALLWKNTLKKEIAGKSALEGRGILSNHPEIDEVIKIEIVPFWVKKIPRVLDKIKLEMELK